LLCNHPNPSHSNIKYSLLRQPTIHQILTIHGPPRPPLPSQPPCAILHIEEEITPSVLLLEKASKPDMRVPLFAVSRTCWTKNR